MWRYYLSTLVHHKWRSYDAWFLSHEAQHNFLSFWVIFDFCPFTPLTIQKIKTLKKWEKKQKTWRYHHFTLVHHKSFYTWWSYDVWFLRYGVQSVLDQLLPFYPTNNLKNQNFEKNEKNPEDIILHKCTKNHDHMLYCSWDRQMMDVILLWSFYHFVQIYTVNLNIFPSHGETCTKK